MILAGRVRSKADARTLHLRQLSELPDAPKSFMASRVARWPTLGNDRLPCCTCAAAAHLIHHWTAAHRAPVTISEDEVVAAFVQVSGGDPSGAEMLEVLKFWRRNGIAERKLHAFVAFDRDNEEDLRTTIYLFGAAYIGLNFPDYLLRHAAKSRRTWRLRRGGAVGENAPNERNGHTVAVVGYDEELLHVVSCGLERTMTWEFYRAYNDEAYALLSHEWYGAERRSPSGFDLQALEREIVELRDRAVQRSR